MKNKDEFIHKIKIGNKEYEAKTYHAFFTVALFTVIVGAVLYKLDLPYRFLKPTIPACKGFNLNETAIVLGAVAAFAGLLIPLHYALSLDIIGKLKNTRVKRLYSKKEGKLVETDQAWLRRYLHTSDIVVYATALFGVSSLIEGALALGYHFQILDNIKTWASILGFCYSVTIGISIVRSYSTMQKAWGLKYRFRSFKVYIIFLIAIGLVVLFWSMVLILYRTISHTAFFALLVLAFFYLMWLLLRVAFIPMSRITKIYLGIPK